MGADSGDLGMGVWEYGRDGSDGRARQEREAAVGTHSSSAWINSVCAEVPGSSKRWSEETDWQHHVHRF